MIVSLATNRSLLIVGVKPLFSFQYLGWNISPFLVTFLEGKLKISFLMPSLLTLLNFKLDLEWKFTNLFLWMLPLFWMIFIIVPRFSLVSILVGLSFKWVVMFVKQLFMFAVFSSLFTIYLFPRTIIYLSVCLRALYYSYLC